MWQKKVINDTGTQSTLMQSAHQGTTQDTSRPALLRAQKRKKKNWKNWTQAKSKDIIEINH